MTIHHVPQWVVTDFPGQESIRAKYPYHDDMAEISGFGGGYEATCQEALLFIIQQHNDGAEAAARSRNALRRRVST